MEKQGGIYARYSPVGTGTSPHGTFISYYYHEGQSGCVRHGA